MSKEKNRLSVQCRQPFLKALGAIFLIAAIALTQIPVPGVQAVDNDFRMDGNTLIKYTGDSANITIPNSVKEIATEAFADNEKLTSVTIPESVTKIENSAFLNCTALKSLTIPDSVKEIGKSAFSGCSALASLSIGTGLTKLGAGAFAGCISLSSATMTEGKTSLSESAISERNTSFTCKDGVIYGKNETVVCQMLAGRKSESYSMPSTVTSIAEYAFWDCENLKKVSLSSNLKEIPAYAFSNCKELEKVDIPYSVNSIQMKAFANCAKLSKIEIPESVSFIHETAFDGCILLEGKIKTTPLAASENTGEVEEEPDNGTQTKDDQDAEVTNQKGKKGNSLSSNSVSSDSVSENIQQIDGMETKEDASVIGKTKIIGGQALVLIDRKQANVISDGISSNAIQNSKNENDISEDGTKVVKEAYYRNDAIKNYEFPDGIKEIEDFAFARSGLSSVTIPNTVEKIGYAAFYHCDELADVTIPESVTQIEGEAFNKTAWMNQWVTDDEAEDYLVVGDGILIAYKGNQNTVAVPDNVKSIATDAFKNHTEITDIIFPDSLTTICDNAFAGCQNLLSFTGGDNLTTIEEHAFDDCPIEITSTEVETKANNYIGTVGKYQVLVKEQGNNEVLQGVKWISIMASAVIGFILFIKVGINSYKKRI